MVYLRRSANDTGVFMCFSKDDVIICNIIAGRWSSSIDFIAVIVATNEVLHDHKMHAHLKKHNSWPQYIQVSRVLKNSD